MFKFSKSITGTGTGIQQSFLHISKLTGTGIRKEIRLVPTAKGRGQRAIK